MLADLILYNGHIQTMVDENDVKSCVAISGNRIAYVGDDNYPEELVGETTKVIDLNGSFVCPGFMDGHLHVPGNWIVALYQINLEGYSTNEEYLEVIRKFVAEHPEIETYYGQPFKMDAYLQEDGSNPGPNKKDLDAICSDKPMILYDVSMHSVWVNSFVLNALNFTKDTPNPEGGIIYKDENGEPTGYLIDNAMYPAIEMFPTLSVTEEIWRDTFTAFQNEAISMGVTGIVDCVDPTFISPYEYQLDHYRQWEKENKLNLRIRPAYTPQPGENPDDVIDIVKKQIGKTTNLVRPGLVKIYGDGVIECGSGVMLEKYLDTAGYGKDWYGGNPLWDTDEFNNMVEKLDAEKLQVHVHVIGDRMFRLTVDAYEKALEANGFRDARHTITHACAIHDDDIPRAARLGVVCAMQFLWMYKDAFYPTDVASIGEEMALKMYPVRKLWDAGCVVSGASDNPVTPFDVLNEIQVGATRNSPYPGERDEDHFRTPDQALTVYEMLTAYTKNVAYENFWEDELGTVEVGKLADLTVLDQNILEIEPRLISDTKVLYTISDGRIVYSAD